MSDESEAKPGAQVIAMPIRVAERLNVPLIADTVDALDESVAREGMSKADVINRAVQVYNELMRIQAAGGALVVHPRRGEPQKWTIS